ncbi:D-alanyl-D-alanine carboxypeptidase family protein [Arthrobacter sp. B3I4]|uniref:M15 family metallopeptidase n=1 Tax=Arthrobacter sp. B3I4 TaxID=3042267 RepID=UPI0027D8E4C0|nr:M15 family metallopeptidase [Arthrobacter sp. B3I4]
MFARVVAATASTAALAALAACSPGVQPPPSPSGTAVPTGPASSSASGFDSPPATPGPSATPTLAPTPTGTANPAPAAPMPSSPAASAPGRKYSLTDPASPWVVVNKHRPLSPATYVPGDLVQPAVRLATSGEATLLNSTTAAAAERMFADAAAAGVVLTLASGYRSYATQAATYNNFVASEGRAAADTASARPGYSEHQTGWSFDIGDGGGVCSFQPCFAQQPAAAWAQANAHRFGFVVRYPWMFHEITGYYYEPWHLRYIGVDAATDMRARAVVTVEEYFGLEPAPSYL